MTETMNLTTITAEDNQTRILNIPTDKLQAFDGHPFKVEENADMQSVFTHRDKKWTLGKDRYGDDGIKNKVITDSFSVMTFSFSPFMIFATKTI